MNCLTETKWHVHASWKMEMEVACIHGHFVSKDSIMALYIISTYAYIYSSFGSRAQKQPMHMFFLIRWDIGANHEVESKEMTLLTPLIYLLSLCWILSQAPNIMLGCAGCGGSVCPTEVRQHAVQQLLHQCWRSWRIRPSNLIRINTIYLPSCLLREFALDRRD